MRAAIVKEVGSPPELGETDEPTAGDGRLLAEVLAAPLNPVDLSIAAGRFYAGPPHPPYVPGNEAVGRVLESERFEPGARVYGGTLAGFGNDGGLAERVALPEATAIEVPDEIDDATAGCIGIAGLTAWLALAWRGELKQGETVLVLGATGAVGQIAVQAAKLLGAGRVVAAARNAEALERTRELGADATVQLGGDDDAEALREATDGGAPLTIDPLWGEPVAVAIRAAPYGGRIVHLGQSAGPEAVLRSGDVRGKLLSILGFSLAASPQEHLEAAYRRMARHVAAGELTIEHETFPLADIADAWRRQEAYPHRKLVALPQPGDR